MLVLTRRQEEGIKIGLDIEIKVLDIKKNAVRLGIIAPRDVTVHRTEIYNLIQKENILASKASKGQIKQLEELIKVNPAKKD
jgi:carbon storage regulator